MKRRAGRPKIRLGNTRKLHVDLDIDLFNKLEEFKELSGVTFTDAVSEALIVYLRERGYDSK